MARVVVVDRENNIVGAETAQFVTENQLIRRIVRVLMFNKNGELFLQMRSPTKNIYPNTWDQSAGGHVDEGDTDEEAAIKELREEIGIVRGHLEYLFSFYCEENYKGIHIKEWNVVYKTIYADDVIKVDGDEVSSGRWFKPKDITNQMQEHPELFCEGFRITWEQFRKTQQ